MAALARAKRIAPMFPLGLLARTFCASSSVRTPQLAAFVSRAVISAGSLIALSVSVLTL